MRPISSYGTVPAAALSLLILAGCGTELGGGGSGGAGCFSQPDGMCDVYAGVEANVTTQLQNQCSGTWGTCPSGHLGICTNALTITRPNGTTYAASRERKFYAPMWTTSSARQDCQTDGGSFQ